MGEERTGVDVDVGALADLATPWCLRVVVTLGVPDHLAAGVGGIEDLAAATASDEQVLWDVLGHLASRGVFEERAPGQFAMNDAGRALLDPSLRLLLDLDGVGGRFAQVWETLPTYIRTGTTAYHERFGVDFWEDLAAHPGIATTFEALMAAGHGGPEQIPPITRSWDAVRTVVDVGGGLGHVLTQIVRTYLEIEGTLVDLPGTAARAVAALAEAGVSERVRVVGQSFFDPLPEGADVYLLRGVLNDWPTPTRRGSFAGAPRPALPPAAS